VLGCTHYPLSVYRHVHVMGRRSRSSPVRRGETADVSSHPCEARHRTRRRCSLRPNRPKRPANRRVSSRARCVVFSGRRCPLSNPWRPAPSLPPTLKPEAHPLEEKRHSMTVSGTPRRRLPQLDQLRPITIERGWSEQAEGSALISLRAHQVLCNCIFHQRRSALDDR
jgi:hypothetical protein